MFSGSYPNYGFGRFWVCAGQLLRWGWVCVLVSSVVLISGFCCFELGEYIGFFVLLGLDFSHYCFSSFVSSCLLGSISMPMYLFTAIVNGGVL